MAFDELMSAGINDYFPSGKKLPLGRRNYSALYIGPTDLANSFEIDQAALRRAKSAESILCSPRIVVNRSANCFKDHCYVSSNTGSFKRRKSAMT